MAERIASKRAQGHILPSSSPLFHLPSRAGGNAVSEYRCFDVSAASVVLFFCSDTPLLRYAVTSLSRAV
jgi:hypothetical protein